MTVTVIQKYLNYAQLKGKKKKDSFSFFYKNF